MTPSRLAAARSLSQSPATHESERESILRVLHYFPDKRVVITSVPQCKAWHYPLQEDAERSHGVVATSGTFHKLC